MSPCSETAVLFYDAACPLCNHAVAFILRHERETTLQFADLNSPEADDLLIPLAIPRDQLVLLEEGQVYRGPEAVLRVCRRLRYPQRLFACARIVPPPLQRMGYRLVARTRYSLFRRTSDPHIPLQIPAGRRLQPRDLRVGMDDTGDHRESPFAN